MTARRLPGGPVLLLGLVGLIGAAAIVAYGLSSKSPAATQATRLHLPKVGLGQLLSPPGRCSGRPYPPGAQYTFERCSPSATPIGWPRCGRVTYSLDTVNAPPGYASDLARAIAQLEAATRLHLTELSGSADISISWDPSLYDPRPGTSGEAGITDFVTSVGLSGARASSAKIRLSSHLQTGATPGIGEEPVLLHELGHAVGLGHYPGPVVMNPMDRGYTTYQPGDLAGLQALYQPQRCVG
jgi:Matrixin